MNNDTILHQFHMKYEVVYKLDRFSHLSNSSIKLNSPIKLKYLSIAIILYYYDTFFFLYYVDQNFIFKFLYEGNMQSN